MKDIKEYSKIESELLSLKDESKDLSIKGIEDKEWYKKVHSAKMKLTRKRTEIDRIWDEMRAEAIAYNKAVRDTKKGLISIISPEEERLVLEMGKIDKEKEEIAQKEKEAKDKINKIRFSNLDEIECRYSEFEISTMSNNEFDKYFETEAIKYEKIIKEREEKAKKEQEEKEKEEKKREEERKKIEEEQEKIRKKQAEIDAKQKIIDDKEAQIKKEQQKIIDEKNAKIDFRREEIVRIWIKKDDNLLDLEKTTDWEFSKIISEAEQESLRNKQMAEDVKKAKEKKEAEKKLEKEKEEKAKKDLKRKEFLEYLTEIWYNKETDKIVEVEWGYNIVRTIWFFKL